MNNLADTISSKAWEVHDALTNAIQNSYKMELESDDNYSAGDPMKSGFAKIRIKGYADGGYLPQNIALSWRVKTEYRKLPERSAASRQ